MRLLGSIFSLLFILAALPQLSTVQRYMPGEYYSGDAVNYVYSKVWTIDKPVVQTLLSYKITTGREKFYNNMVIDFRSSILKKIAGKHFDK